MSRPNHCVYCLLRVDPNDNFLHCLDCNKDVHITCLKRPGTPGDIVGDVFFDFRCSHCTDDGAEVFQRQHLPWAMMVAMALHNLSVQSRGLSHHGFFHWRTHIACFIEKNWTYLIGGTMKKKKKWIGTISGTLSHNTPVMFMSGFAAFNEQGWWKLSHNLNPKQYMEFYNTQRTERMREEKALAQQHQQKAAAALELQQQQQQRRQLEQQLQAGKGTDGTSSDDDVDVLLPATKRLRTDAAVLGAAVAVEPVETFSRSIPYMGRSPWKKKKISTSEQSSIEAELTAFLSSNIANVDMTLDLAHMAAGLTDENDALPAESLIDLDFLKNVDLMKQFEQGAAESEPHEAPHNDADDDDDKESGITTINETGAMYEPRIVQVTNFQTGDRDYEEDADAGNATASIKQEPRDDEDDSFVAGAPQPVEDVEEDYDTKYPTVASLFRRNPDRNRQPWLNDDARTEPSDAATFDETPAETLTAYEEAELLRNLRHIFRCSDRRETAAIPAWVHRIHRKLCIRETKRSLGRPIFDVDEQLLQNRRYLQTGASKRRAIQPQVLDRYHQLVCGVNRVKSERRAGSWLAGSAGTFEMFESPHTGRVLHPFVYRNAEQMPAWVRLMCELQYRVNGRMPTRATVDYCYVRPQHIAAVNGLLERAFWPGIDMSECLSYPEFSIVALYKQLVVGCAFLVPDVGHNDAYISFMAVRPGWQRAGIATFMLYHLTQTCLGRDITLHVSATNAAVCLYQKFGFKIEEVILDFYEKYLGHDSVHSRHAFFLRLTR